MSDWLGVKPCGREVPCPNNAYCVCRGREEERLEDAEGKLNKLAKFLDERDALMRLALGFPDTVEVVAKVTTNDIRGIVDD